MPIPIPETVKLKKTGHKWEFQSEAHLEDFLWSCLGEILGATPLKRQFSINGQFCDILAVAHDKRLLIIELKNEEDRYVVSQITRYYDALLEEKPLKDLVDYSQTIQPVVIAPSFHRDNLIDRKYSQLNIKFLQFDLLVTSNNFTFNLNDIENNKKLSITFPYQQELQNRLIPEPPRKLLNLLAEINECDRKAILTIREKIMTFHDRMKEFPLNSNILYGSTKTKSCAELRYDETRKTLALFLWLPHVTSRGPRAKQIIARMRIWTDWQNVSALGHITKGSGRMISFEEYHSGSVKPLKKLLPPNSWGDSPERFFSDKAYREKFVERRKYLALNPHYTSGIAMSTETYFTLIKRGKKSFFLQDLINLALETWIEKL
ncbi:MAG: endonuclease NucS domain-containing protein [Crocosphaera sp.]